MANSVPSDRAVRFGVFEADPKSGELRKNGLKIRIQEQPFQILMLLLERPGDVVSREELRLKLWPADTFVDFDHGLNTAINKLRDALGDTAGNPRFVETLARRGYRFIAPVQWPEPVTAEATPQTTFETQASGMAQPEAPAVPASVAEPPLAVQKEEESAAELPSPTRGLTRGLFALVQVMYLVFYAVALAKLDRIGDIVNNVKFGIAVIPIVLVTAAIGIAIRLYLLTAVSFDYRPLGEKFRRIFPLVLPLDQVWALSPFLLVQQIGIGAAFAATAALLYLPFSERTLIRMGYKY